MAPRDLQKARHVLEQAVERFGSRHHLAKALKVKVPDLMRWLAGEEPVPAEIVLRAIELAAGKPQR
jgi:hypothetical protein